MPRKCPVCLQALPVGISESTIETRLQKLSLPALELEKKRLKEEFSAKLDETKEATRELMERKFALDLRAAQMRAKQDAERDAKKQLQDAERRASQAEARIRKEVAQARREEQARLKSDIAQGVRLAKLESEARVERIQAQREQDKVRNEAERVRMQGKLDELSRKLDRQSGEQLGSEAELDLYTELKRTFPSDRIERIGKGVKGADIEHKVMEGTKVAGTIIYESKNTSTWGKEFIPQAKKYMTLYETSQVIIVSRVFPPKFKNVKGLCVDCGIPIIERRMAVALASVIRDGVLEIAKLRLTSNFNAEKSQELYEYIVSDKFCTRFREIAEKITELREIQQKEKRSHELMWQEESRIHERIQNGHSIVDAQINAIVQGAFGKGIQSVSTKSRKFA